MGTLNSVRPKAGEAGAVAVERRPGEPFTPDVETKGALPLVAEAANRKNMILLIQLRWIAVVGQIVTIVAVQAGLGIDLPLAPMSVVLAGLIALNVASFAWLRQHAEVSDRAMLMVLVLDVAALTAQLWLSGGVTNPFVSLFLLQITLAAVLLDAASAWVVVALTFGAVVGLTLFHRSLGVPGRGIADMFSVHIAGTLVCYVLDATLLVVFVTRITLNMRERDGRLAALKQRAAEEDHIVRMGLLATGAAHELGTPLSSLSVILGDWSRMPAISLDPDMAQELEEMQASVQRCKAIVTGILLSAGEARGVAPVVTSVARLFDEIVAEWSAARSSVMLSYENQFGQDLAIVSDAALKQIVFNVLDNAFDASPRWIGLAVERDGDHLVLRVSDRGPGFAPDMLARIGTPYHSTKGRLGGGLGLFLVVNVVRKLGGIVEACNNPYAGATVTLRLPLATLAIGADSHDG